MFDNFLTTNEALKLDQDMDLEVLRKIIEEQVIKVLLIDPLYPYHSLNEDSSSDMAPFLSKLKQLTLELGISVVMVHHQGKRNENSSSSQTGHRHRGSSSLADVPDASWSMQKKEDGVATLSFECRNHAPLKPLTIKMDKRTRWIAVGEEQSNSKSSKDLQVIVREEPGITYSELVEMVKEAFQVSERTAKSKISDAVKLEFIRKESDGKLTRYYEL